MSGLLAYWYHFAIMFEALFILTTIDSGTRVGRFLMQEFMGKVFKPFARPGLAAGRVYRDGPAGGRRGGISSTPATSARSGRCSASPTSCSACVALAVATTILINMGKTRYIWVTVLPLSFLATNTLYGGFLNIRDNFWPLATGPDPAPIPRATC